MSDPQLDQTTHIISNPSHYKVCDACESIVTKTTIICPNCHAFRFQTDPEYIIDRALHQAASQKEDSL